MLSTTFNQLRTTLLSLAWVLILSACGGGDTRDPTPINPDFASSPPNGDAPVNNGSGSDSVENGQYRIELSATQFNLTEGGDVAEVNINLVRTGGHSAPVALSIEGRASGSDSNINWFFDDGNLDGSDTLSRLHISVPIGRAPIQPQTRQLTIEANDGSSEILAATITLDITPTTASDVYLLIGQSNMVGLSLEGARDSEAGGLDEPTNDIRQLNVTGNDSTNFPNAAAFTDVNSIANPDAPLVRAIDPLHEGYDFTINGKESTRIGLGMSFANAMLPSTTSRVLLVPAAWSDSGFCKRETNPLPGLGWNATEPTDTDNFAGTLLHDRALARLNLALLRSGGIFRGILWHQGEADSDNEICAAQYAENLKALVASIRTNAMVDARGRQARGAAADIPFVAGTMSRGREFANFGPSKEIVDGVHQNVSSLMPFAATVHNDDLTPRNNYPCGQGGCIHFGELAYREVGFRYAEQMRLLQAR